MKVIITKEIQKRLRKHFKKFFPKEQIAILLGTVGKEAYYIEEVYIPENQNCGNNFVFMSYKDYDVAKILAKEKNLQVIGDIHSHCFKFPVSDAAPSEADWRGTWALQLGCTIKKPIFGILKIDKLNERFRTRFTFWNMSSPLIIEKQ